MKTSVYFKPTRTCSYILWNSNTPRHVKQGRIVAECIRFLRICSHEEFFCMCWSRVKGALVRLRYPKHTYHMPPRQWADRARYLGPRKRNTDMVHVVRVPFPSSMPIPCRSIRVFMNRRYLGTISRFSLCFFSHLVFARMTATTEAANTRTQQRQLQADFYTHLSAFYYRQEEH